MLNPYERWVYFHRFILDSSPAHAPQIELKGVIEHLKQLVDSGGAFKMVENDEACFRIRDLKINYAENSAVFLLMYSNSKASDPVFSKLTTTDLRPEPKLEGEGIAVSAHAVLRLVPTEGGGNEYLFLLEEVPGLGRSGLEGFFQTMFRAVTKGQLSFFDEEENGRSRSFRPRVRILATPSKTFQEELEGSTVDNIELVERIKISHFDEEHYYQEDVRTLKLKVVDGNGEKASFIEKLRKKAKKEGFDDLKIHYKKNGGKRQTAVMGTDTDDVKDALVGRVEYLEYAPGLAQCSDKIINSYAKKILGLLE